MTWYSNASVKVYPDFVQAYWDPIVHPTYPPSLSKLVQLIISDEQLCLLVV